MPKSKSRTVKPNSGSKPTSSSNHEANPSPSTQTQGANDVKIAVFRVGGGAVYIPYSDPATLQRILEGVKMLRGENKEESKEG